MSFYVTPTAAGPLYQPVVTAGLTEQKIFNLIGEWNSAGPPPGTAYLTGLYVDVLGTIYPADARIADFRFTNLNRSFFYIGADTVCNFGGGERTSWTINNPSSEVWTSWKTGAASSAIGTVALSGGAFFLSQNVYRAGAGQVRQQFGLASQYVQSQGDHVFSSAPSGGAGSGAFYTNSLIIRGSNNSLYVGAFVANRTIANGTGVLNLIDASAPSGTVAAGNMVSFYSIAGEAYVMDALGNQTLLSPHDRGTNEWVFDSTLTPTGKRIKIRVEKLLRFLNDHHGLDLIEESEVQQ